MSTYQVITPAGGFNAVYDDEESPVEYQGDEIAISFFKNWVEINQISGEHGHLLDSNNIQPFELYGFCQPPESGIIVIPPLDELIDIGIENAFSEQNNEEKESEMEQPSIAFDAVSGSEKLKLVRELGSIRTSISSVISGMEKLKLVKRVKEIRELLGVKSADPNFTAIETPQFQIGDYVFAIKDIGFYGRDEMRINHIKTDYDSNKQMLKLEDKGSQYWNASDFKLSRRSGDVGGKAKQPEKTENTIEDVNAVMPMLKRFIGKSQLSAVGMSIRGEEKQFFIDKMLEIANTIQTMPKTYGQDGMGDEAVAYLHYFKGSADWYITEKDMENEQLQAFGLADLFGDGGELGYISIEELIGSGVELDFNWKPKTIGEIRGGGSREEAVGDNSAILKDGSKVDASRSFLQSVIDGTADMDAETFPDQIEKAAKELGDGDVLVIQAANVYADYITKKSKELLS